MFGSLALVKEYMRESVLAIAPENIQFGFLNALNTARLRAMPNAWLHSTQILQPGLLILGDAANMRHPISASGMMVELKDVVLIARMLHPHNVASFKDSQATLSVVRSFHWKRKTHSVASNILHLGPCLVLSLHHGW